MPTSRPRALLTPITALLLLSPLALDACARHEPAPAERRAAATVKPVVKALPLAAVHAPKALATTARAEAHMPPGVLPKYKTAGEKAADAKRRTNRVGYRDQFDDFRKQYISYYHTTKAPVKASMVAPEYSQSQGWLITWNGTLGSGDQFMIDQIKAGWGVVPMILAFSDANHKAWLQQQLTAAGLNATDATKVSYFSTPMDSIWARDFGPFGILETGLPAGTTPKLSFVDFRYYHQRVLDDQIPTAMAKAWGINVYRPDMELEGGNFMSTSDGLCASSKGALWYNQQLSQSAIEQLYKDYLGCTQSLFPTPLDGEGTTHLDMFSKFSTDTTVLVGQYTTAQDAQNKALLDANATLFAGATMPTGKTMKVVRIPMPSNANRQIWRTYTNSLALNGATKKAVIFPTFSDEKTYEAAAVLAYQQAFPGWTITGVDSKAVIPWGGAVHCTTMQIPVGAKAKMEADPPALCGATNIDCSNNNCGSVTALGCCDGQVLKYCNNKGQLSQQDCAAFPACGWNPSQGYYECGTTGAADPSGTYPKSCTAPTADAGVTPDNGAPGVDAGTPADSAVPGFDSGATGCGGVTFEGCCDGDSLRFCENNKLEVYACTPGSCGWNPAGGFYDCDTTGGADPSGAYPKACAAPVDAGTPKLDSGTPKLDSGTPKLDSGTPKLDSGTPKLDSGTPKLDSGTPKLDSGTPKLDSGTPKPDSGTSTPDSAVKADTSAPSKDAGASADSGSKGGSNGGCAVAGGETPSLAWLLALLGLVALRRRD
jgi:agmatine deiminase